MRSVLTLERPSLLVATQAIVKVLEPDGTPFYVRKMTPGKTFRVPCGNWIIEGAKYLRHLRRGIGFNTSGTPENFLVTVGVNPNKATVWPDSGKILLDYSLADYPYECRAFILLHELGHYFHSSEEKCDAFAARAMKRNGFNPSQIARATRMTLSHHSANRHKLNEKRARRLDRRA